MGHVIFVPGLRGIKALAAGEPVALDPSSNEFAVKTAAEALGWAFHKASYQTAARATPRLSEMEQIVADQLSAIRQSAPDEPLLIVGSSVGFGVALGSLARMQASTSPMALLGFKPVPDPLDAISLQIAQANPQALPALKAGHIPGIPLPVEGGDVFPLSKDHVVDDAALHILSNPASRDLFNGSAGGALRDCRVIYGAQDHLTPSVHMEQFRDAVLAVQTGLIRLEGNHATTFTAELSKTVTAMARALG